MCSWAVGLPWSCRKTRYGSPLLLDAIFGSAMVHQSEIHVAPQDGLCDGCGAYFQEKIQQSAGRLQADSQTAQQKTSTTIGANHSAGQRHFHRHHAGQRRGIVGYAGWKNDSGISSGRGPRQEKSCGKNIFSRTPAKGVEAFKGSEMRKYRNRDNLEPVWLLPAHKTPTPEFAKWSPFLFDLLPTSKLNHWFLWNWVDSFV